MKTQALHSRSAAAFIVFLVSALTLASAGGESKNESVIEIQGIGDVVKLEKLEDGETRVIREGDPEITATRDGRTIRIVTKNDGSEQEIMEVLCTGSDGCDDKILVRLDSDAAEDLDILTKVISSTISYESLSGDDGASPKKHVFVFQGAGENDDASNVFSGSHQIFLSQAGGEEAGILQKLRSPLLRCPEGDATLRITEEDAEQAFFCPRHGIEMEKSNPRKSFMIQKNVIVETDKGADKNE